MVVHIMYLKISAIQILSARIVKQIISKIFVEKTNLDTTMRDEWYQLNLQLQYPNKITVSPTFVSEKSIVTHIKKETIKPPKKCKFARWFQRKHKVVVVDIKENNPYITTEDYQHIEIIKP